MSLQTFNRLMGLDLIKVIACFLVVVLHTCHPKDTHHVEISSILYYSGVIAIPLFFITNGYLLFGKTQKDKWYLYKKIGRILLLTFVLNGLICVLYALIKHRFFNPFIEVGLNLFFMTGYFWHFWFLGSLIFIYLLFPLLDDLYRYKQSIFLILSISLISIQCLVDVLNIYSSIKFSDLFQLHIPQTFRLESHFSYFILGGILKSFNTRIAKYATLQNVIILYILVLIYQFFMIRYVYYPILYCEYFYDNLLVIGLSSLIFIYLSNIQEIKSKKVIFATANLIMIIYIIHPFIIKLYNKSIGLNVNIIKLITVFSISVLLSWIISKIPYIKLIFKF